MERRRKKRSAEEEGRENGVTRTVVIPSAWLGFRKFLALAEVEKEYLNVERARGICLRQRHIELY